MFSIDDVDALWDHIGYVILYAPDAFPEEDFLSADQQMDLERAFDMLRQGVGVAYPEVSHASKCAELNDVLDRSLASYQAGDDATGSHLLSEFQNSIFKSE